jgi:ATP-dependent helicase HrpA
VAGPARAAAQAARNAGLTPNDADASRRQVHIAVLSGLLSQVGLREGETREYLGARGAKFMIFPARRWRRRPRAG